MGLLGGVTVVSAQVGRKVNNALTVTFKTSETQTLATAVQAKSLGVLFGFKNGGAGRYTISGGDGAELSVTCDIPRSQVSTDKGSVIGTIEKDEYGDGILKAADGTTLARIARQPKDKKSDFAWQHPLADAAGGELGKLTWVRTGGFDLLNEIITLEMVGGSLKTPSVGAHLVLNQPVPEPLGDLLLATCVDMTVGTHSFVEK